MTAEYPLTAEAARFITRTRAAQIPREVMHLGKRSLLAKRPQSLVHLGNRLVVPLRRG